MPGGPGGPGSPLLGGSAGTPGGGVNRRFREWAPAVTVGIVAAWLTVGLVLAAHLSLFQRWHPATSPYLDDTVAAPPVAAGGVAVKPLAKSSITPAWSTAQIVLSSSFGGGGGSSSSGSAGNPAAPTGGSNTGGLQTSNLAKTDAAVGQGSATTAQASHTGGQSPAGSVGNGPVWGSDPSRLSGLGPPLSEAELRGGWKLTWEVYDRVARHPNATVVSRSSPRVLLIRDFLAAEEVEHLVRQATGGFERSEVVSDDARQHEARTSFGAWLNGAKRDARVLEVQHRIHQLVGIPEEFGESLYVLRYADGQKYEPHTDHCAHVSGQPATQSCREFLERSGGPKCGPGGGGVTCGDRLATFILYLRSPTRGGATVFPKATAYTVPKFEHEPGAGPGQSQAQAQQQHTSGSSRGTSSEAAADDSVQVSRRRKELQQGSRVLHPRHGTGRLTTTSTAITSSEGSGSGSREDGGVSWFCREGADALQVAPPPGSAVLFWDYVPAGSSWQPGDLAAPDPTSVHGGCPVLEGEKMIATRWIRAAEFH